MTHDDHGRSLDAPAKLAAAQARIAASLPYLAARAYRFRPVPVPGMGTAGTDRGMRLAYDPLFVATLSVPELTTIMVHELGHHVLSTWDRRGSRPKERWNIATDAEINSGIVARAALPWRDGFEPITAEHIGSTPGLTAEEYDAHLARREEERKAEEESRKAEEAEQPEETEQDEQQGPQNEPQDQDDQGADDGPADDEEGDGDGTGEPGDDTDEKDQGDEQPAHDGPEGDPATDGTGAGTGEGEPRIGRGAPGTADAPDADDIAAILPPDAPPPVSAEEKAIDDWQTANAIEEYQQHNGPGSVPGALSVWASGHLKPKRNPWQQILRSRIRRECSLAAGHDDFSRRIARRYWGTLALLGPEAPIERGTEAHHPRVAIVADTSRSMEGAYGTIQAEALQIARAVTSGRADFVAVDAAVQGRTRIRSGSTEAQLRDAMQGGGGTDMRIGIAEAERLGADVVVVLTDGETPWPTREEARRLRVRIVVALVGPGQDPPGYLGRPVRVTMDG